MEVPEGYDYRQAPVKISGQYQEKTYEKWDVLDSMQNVL